MSRLALRLAGLVYSRGASPLGTGGGRCDGALRCMSRLALRLAGLVYSRGAIPLDTGAVQFWLAGGFVGLFLPLAAFRLAYVVEGDYQGGAQEAVGALLVANQLFGALQDVGPGYALFGRPAAASGG